ncbi:MAG: small-conductance mechanosensitive channel [Flavobacteriaceae bacterium]|nr:MAG: small-conductance mechanosensitive channel [Flavobacteriaceae bacterium]
MILTTQLNDLNSSFLDNMWSGFLDFIPKALLAIAFFIVAIVVLKIVNFVLSKVLKVTNIDSLTTKLNEAELFGKSDFTVQPSVIILKFVKFLVIMIFVIIGAEKLGLHMITEGIGSFIAYLPVLITALLIFVVGVYLGSVVKGAILNTFKSLEISGSSLVSNIAFYAIVVIVTITALNQAGIDTSMITSNLTMIVGAMLASFTIAFGLGARDVILRLLLGFYTRKNIGIGQSVEIGEIKGVVTAIDNITLSIKTEDGIIMLPIKDVVDSEIKLK